MYTLDTTDKNVFEILRSFILDTLGTAVAPDNVLRIPTNRVATPSTFPYITMFPVSKTQIAWPSVAVSDPVVQPQSEGLTMPTEYQIQVDAYGPTAGDLIQILHAVLQSPNAFDYFSNQTIKGVYPIHADAPRELPLVDGEAEYELRWVMDVHLQYNPTVTTAIQTASQAVVGIINVEATYH